jgi:hypothetical protein
MWSADFHERPKTITVLLKGDPDGHRVPITDDFWPLFHSYLRGERNTATAI